MYQCKTWCLVSIAVAIINAKSYYTTRYLTVATIFRGRMSMKEVGLSDHLQTNILHYSQKNHCNDNCNDFSDYNDIIAPLEMLITSFKKTHKDKR